MKQILGGLIILLLMTSCSLMRNMMMKRMEKMSDEERMEMMAKMMSKGDSSSCNEMMGKMSGMFMDDSLSKADMASRMMPVCVENILLTLDNDIKAKFLADLTERIIVNNYDSIPEKDRPYFKRRIIKTIEELE
jgi:hypothetical protein